MKTHSFSPYGDRYRFDFKLCTPEKGWAQLDTRQDASYYGNWINPTTFQLVSYAEGDLYVTSCQSRAEFQTEVLACLEWHRANDYHPAIDGMCDPRIIAAFHDLGLGNWLH